LEPKLYSKNQICALRQGKAQSGVRL
jgi:hypothetical protein